MRRTLCTLCTLAVALALPLALGAQAPGLQARRERLQRELDARTFAAVTRVVDDAASRGLPAEPLVNKALEGLTMRRPGDAIRLGVERLAQRLDTARRALAPASAADMEAGAEALAAGVPSATLQEIRGLRPNEPVAVPLGVLTQLVMSRVPVPRAAAMVTKLMREGTRPPQLIALGEEVNRDVATGWKPEEALDVRVHGILAGTGTVATDASAVPAELRTGNATDRSGNKSTRGATRAPRRP